MLIMHIQTDDLGALLPRGSAVYTVVTHESRSGANCRVLVLAIVQGEIVSVTASAAALIGRAVEHGQVQISGARAHAGRQFVDRVDVACIRMRDRSSITHSANADLFQARLT
jgi:hypothetical protein